MTATLLSYLRARIGHLDALVSDLSLPRLGSRGHDADEVSDAVLAARNDARLPVVYTMDWSELYAYLTSERIDLDPQEREVFGDGNVELVRAMHQIALHVVFDRGLLGNILLLPCYLRELFYFFQRLQQSIDSAADSAAWMIF